MAYNTWTEGDVLYASDLNENFTLITAVLHSITGGQMAADAINAGTIIAADIIDETHINYSHTTTGLGVLQIGKDRATYEQMLLKGTSAIAAANTTNTSITITYANADCATGGEPNFVEVPHIYATCYTDMGVAGAINILAAGTDSCLINVDPASGDTFTEQWVVYWQVVGNF